MADYCGSKKVPGHPPEISDFVGRSGSYIDKCECYIHSLKQGETNVLAEATIIKRLGDNDYLAEYNGVRCHAIFNPFVGRYYVDDKYGIIHEQKSRNLER